MIAARDVRRVYLALAHGRIAWESASIDAPIGRDPAARLRMAVVAAKAKAAWAASLTAIICVGETEAQRNAGEELKIVEKQIVESVPEGANAGNTVIAYEPVWAIGTGKTPTTGDVEAMHWHIRALLKQGVTGGAEIRILYGGSVKPSNAAELPRFAILLRLRAEEVPHERLRLADFAERLDAVGYAGVPFYKAAVLFFKLIPYVAPPIMS